MSSTFADGDVIRTKENKAFRVVSTIGAGGMSEVYKALDHSMSRNVVLKLLAPRARPHAERFVQEAKLLANVSHPNVARVFERGETVEGHPYYTMECLKAWSLREVLLTRAAKKEFGLRWGVAVNMMVEILDGLGALHEAGIVHRDMKPENVLLAVEHGKQKLKIIDPGIAKLLDDDRIEGLVATPLYAAPEQLVEVTTTATPASDVFSAGLLFYELVTGHHAYAIYGHNLEAAMERRNKPVPAVTQIRPNVAPAVEQIIFAMTRIDPMARPTALQALDMLERLGLAANYAAEWEKARAGGRRQIITESGLRPQEEVTRQGRITRADLEAPTDPDGEDVAPNVRYMQMLAEQGRALGYEPVAYVQKMTGGVSADELDRRLIVGLAETSPGGIPVLREEDVMQPGVVITAMYETKATSQPAGVASKAAPQGSPIDRNAPTMSARPTPPTHTPIMGEESHRVARTGSSPAILAGSTKGGTAPMRPGYRAEDFAPGGQYSGVIQGPVDTLPSTATPHHDRASRTPPSVRVSAPGAADAARSPKPAEKTPLPTSTAGGSRVRVAGAPVSSRKTPARRVPGVPEELDEARLIELRRDRRNTVLAFVGCVAFLTAILFSTVALVRHLSAGRVP